MEQIGIGSSYFHENGRKQVKKKYKKKGNRRGNVVGLLAHMLY